MSVMHTFGLILLDFYLQASAVDVLNEQWALFVLHEVQVWNSNSVINQYPFLTHIHAKIVNELPSVFSASLEKAHIYLANRMSWITWVHLLTFTKKFFWQIQHQVCNQLPQKIFCECSNKRYQLFNFNKKSHCIGGM